jgi:hypothetical protein
MNATERELADLAGIIVAAVGINGLRECLERAGLGGLWNAALAESLSRARESAPVRTRE